MKKKQHFSQHIKTNKNKAAMFFLLYLNLMHKLITTKMLMMFNVT